MGDRANIVCVESGGGRIYLYTHWTGTELPTTLASALDRGRGRWGDESYLTQIIFSEMVSHGDDLMAETGYGISTYEIDMNHENLVVNLGAETVTDRDGNTVSFEDFVAYHKASL